jgi:replicative DNA helicase
MTEQKPRAAKPAATIAQLRMAPQSIVAEQAVLGGVMLDPSAIWRVLDTITEACFYRHGHRLIWRAILELHTANRPFDVVTLGTWFDQHGLSQHIDGSAYLIELAQTTPSAANITAYAEIVREQYMLRTLIEAGTKVVENAFNAGSRKPLELIAEAQSAIGHVLLGQPSQLESPATIIDELIAEAAEASEDQLVIRGLTTGLPDLDLILGGMRGGQMIVVAGRPKMGKTTLAVNIAEHVGLALRRRVAIHSLEMLPKELMQRMICSLGYIDATRMRSNDLTQDEWSSWSLITGKLRQAPIDFSGPRNVVVDQLIAQTQRAHAENPISLVVVDYAQLIDVSSSDNQNIGYGEVSRKLKLMAGAMNAVVILVSQLNRKLEERGDKRPILSDLRASGSLEQDADAIVFVYRDEIYHKRSEDRGTAEIIVAAQRGGKPGTARVLADLDHYRFAPLPLDFVPAPLPDEPSHKARKGSGAFPRVRRDHSDRDDD